MAGPFKPLLKSDLGVALLEALKETPGINAARQAEIVVMFQEAAANRFAQSGRTLRVESEDVSSNRVKFVEDTWTMDVKLSTMESGVCPCGPKVFHDERCSRLSAVSTVSLGRRVIMESQHAPESS